MAIGTDLRNAIIEQLDEGTVSRFFDQMGSNINHQFTPNEYESYVQVITWALLDKLRAKGMEVGEGEATVKPIVDREIRNMCTVLEDLTYPEFAPASLLSRVTWYSMKLFGRELK